MSCRRACLGGPLSYPWGIVGSREGEGIGAREGGVSARKDEVWAREDGVSVREEGVPAREGGV
ncbi:hypothetical protein BDV93DRAFT_521137 [Ceratobasidium sp. AG-I]|nr:hypothetical protein BDV93DRAFT_521137 [Ceratobasidium sp. AG-I]